MKRRRRKHQRRNPQTRPWWHYALAAGTGGAVGITAAILIARKIEQTPEILEVIDDVQIRLPQPSLKMVLPETIEEFAVIDDLICEVGAPLVSDAPPGTTIDDVVRNLQRGIALELYPDFPWPPMAGDHPTVSQLWTELGYEARRAVVTGSICDGRESVEGAA